MIDWDIRQLFTATAQLIDGTGRPVRRSLRTQGSEQNEMAGRTLLPLLALGVIGFVITSLGLGYGLAQYTLSGVDPFYAATRGSAWQTSSTHVEQTRPVSAEQFAVVFEPDAQR